VAAQDGYSKRYTENRRNVFKIYSSSAGSGKTYTLTKEYLKLALAPDRKPDYFRSILAVTFTNAAANEMKDRILRELQQMAGSGDVSPLLNDLTTELYKGVVSGTPAFTDAQQSIRQKAELVFRTILHRYADFSVTTIDSFTQRVVTAFTDELGLPYSFEVEMDTSEVLEEAIDTLLEKAGTDEMDEITTVLREYYMHTATEGDSWLMLPQTLSEFGHNLTSDQFYQAVTAAQELSPGAIRAIRQQLIDHNKQVETDIIGLGQQAWQLIVGQGLSETDFTYGNAGVGGYIRGVAQGESSKDVGTRVLNAINEGAWYGKKTPLTTQGLIDHIAPDLTDCIQQIIAIRDERGSQVTLFTALLPHLQKLALLKQIRLEFDELLRKDGRVHISEFNKKILSIVTSEPVPFLYERLGTRYNHILIDEFQDTSRLQFANLLPLIENSVASDQFNLAVGDGKQAIYRFRGGDMDQIVALHRQDLDSLQQAHGPDSWTADRIDTLRGHIDPALLDTNWRSAQPIVRFNNDFFEHTARRFEGDHRRVSDVFDAEKNFHQKVSAKARPEGHVQIDFVAADTENGIDLTKAMLDQTLLHLHQAKADGYQYGDIAILCRTKRHARALAHELNRLRIPLVSADSLSLESSEPVKWLVTVMQVLQRPDQKLLRYELLYLFHRVVYDVFPDNELASQLRTVAETGHEAVFEYLRTEGYPLDPHALGQLNPYELAERLTAQFNLFAKGEDNPFLFRFLDEVLTFNAKRSGHLSDFLLYWQGASAKISVEGAKRDAVHIQTIHKAKGLEFPVVIIPFANWDTAPKPKSTIWLDLSGVRTDALSFQDSAGTLTRLLSAPVHPTQRLKQTPEVIRAQYTDEVTRTFLEHMNVLYVAFTRAADRLYIISERLKRFDGERNTIAQWLYGFLNDSLVAKACGCQWQEGQSSYIVSQCTRQIEKKDEITIDEIELDDVISGSRGQDLQLRRQADRIFDVATFERTREQDRKLAAALSLIRGPGCIEKALRQLVSEGLVRQSECDELGKRLRAIVMHTDLDGLFDPTRRIDTDRSILSARRLHGAPHRVVHGLNNEITLIQYVSPAEATAESGTDSAESLRYFIRLYRDMDFPEVDGRLVYLYDEPVVVRL
jgi:ATP-dependent exoDNAse (exonuclease V) beta subunit